MATQSDPDTSVGSALRTHWRLSLVVMLMFGILGFGYYMTFSERYEAEATVAFTLRPERVVGGDIVRLELSKYTYFVTSDATIEQVAADLGLDPADLGEGTSAVYPGETATFFIRVAMSSPEDAQAAANRFAEEVVQFSETDEMLVGSVLTEAVVPDETSGPPMLLIVVAALAVGAVVGLAAAALLDQVRPQVHSAHQAAALAGLPVVGTVPHVRTPMRQPEDLYAPAALDAQPSVRVLTNLLPGESNHAVTITSPRDGDGKSFVAAVLASSYASLGFSVLLVEADTHPTLFADASADQGPGLFTVLDDHAQLSDAIRPGPFPGMAVLPAGKRAERVDVAPHVAASLIALLKEHADLVVIDGGALLGGALGATFVAAGDEALLVVPRKTLVADLHLAAGMVARHADNSAVMFNDRA